MAPYSSYRNTSYPSSYTLLTPHIETQTHLCGAATAP